MRVSQTGIDLIKHFEGLETHSYQDVAGIWTIGYGHTGAEVGPGQTISEDQAEQILRDDLGRFEDGVTGAIKVPVNQNQFDALISLTFNIGLGAFKSSTVLKRLNAKDYEGAAEAITWWNKSTVNGQKVVIKGLVTRRAAEKALFLQPVEGFLGGNAGGADSSRITPQENSPRRENIAGSRTVEGSVVAGGAGAASAGAAWMNRDDNETATTDTAASQPPVETPVPETTPGESGATETGDSSGTDTGDSGTGQSGSADTGTLTTTTGTSETQGATMQDISKEQYLEAFQIVAGVVIVIAVLYIIIARIDDWLNFKR